MLFFILYTIFRKWKAPLKRFHKTNPWDSLECGVWSGKAFGFLQDEIFLHTALRASVNSTLHTPNSPLLKYAGQAICSLYSECTGTGRRKFTKTLKIDSKILKIKMRIIEIYNRK